MNEISSSFDFRTITPLFKNNKNLILGKFVYDENIPSEVLFPSLMKNLEELMNRDILRLALLAPNRVVDGAILLERSEWDSEHLGMNIANLKLVLFNGEVNLKNRCFFFQKVKDAAKSQGFSVIFAKITLKDPLTVHSLERQGAILTDVLLTFYINLVRRPEPVILSPLTNIVEASRRDKQALMEMSRKIFKINHFHADPYLPRNRCNELYAKWVSNCINGLVDKVLIAKKSDKTLGFITCRVEHIVNGHSYGVIDLVGVKEEQAGKGIGSLLVTKALEWFSNCTRSVYVGTQAANIPAIRLYEKAGFRQVFSEATLHLWIF